MSDFKPGDRVVVSQQLVNNTPTFLLTDGSVQAMVGECGTVESTWNGFVMVRTESGETWPMFEDELIKEP